MAGKSIEDILRQQAAQRQAQIQQQQAQERALYEQRERARQDYLQRMRMYEALSNINPSAAAAAAGGTGKKPVINGHTEIILFSTTDSDNWQYIIIDFLAGTISKVKDTEISNNEGYDYYIVENTGYVFEFDSKILFINDNAEIIESLDKTDLLTSRYRRSYYYAIMNDGTLYQFDGKVVTTYTVTLGTDGTDIQVSKNSLAFASYDIDHTTNIYVWNPTIGLVKVWTGVNTNGDANRYNALATSDDSPFIAVATFDDVTNGWKTINIFGDDGTTKSALDITVSANNLNTGYLNMLINNKLVFFNFKGSGSTYYFNIYDYNHDTWRTSTHSKSNYGSNITMVQNIYDGSQYTSLSSGFAYILHGTASGYTYNINRYNYADVVWSIDGATPSTFVIDTGNGTKGIDTDDGDRDGYSNSSLYLGKSFFFPITLADNNFRLLCLTSTQSVNISVGLTASLSGGQGDSDKIPGFNSGQRYASFRFGDNFGVWLAYNSTDVYKIYNEFGRNLISLTMSSTDTRLQYTGEVAVITNNNTGVEYVFNSALALGLSPSYATYSALSYSHYGLKPSYTDGDKTPSLMINLDEGGTSRMYTDTDVHDFTLPDMTWARWLSDEYSIHLAQSTNYVLYFYDWTGTLLATVDTGIASGTSYNAELVKDRLFFKVTNGSTITYYCFTPTKTDSITLENASEEEVLFDSWPWWVS
jgi:hypothetical protein